jgi:hypothetical protein
MQAPPEHEGMAIAGRCLLAYRFSLPSLAGIRDFPDEMPVLAILATPARPSIRLPE